MSRSNVAAQMREQIAATKRRDPPPEMEEIVRRWLEGESQQVLAAECGVNRKLIQRRIKRWVLTGSGDKGYVELVTEALVNRIADADEKLEAATDPVQVAKWRDVARFARMDFERRRPALYGSKPVTMNVLQVVPDAGLIGRASELLQLAAAEKVVEALPMPADDVC
jgi:hypothetical protein